MRSFVLVLKCPNHVGHIALIFPVRLSKSMLISLSIFLFLLIISSLFFYICKRLFDTSLYLILYNIGKNDKYRLFITSLMSSQCVSFAGVKHVLKIDRRPKPANFFGDKNEMSQFSYRGEKAFKLCLGAFHRYLH